MQPGALQRFQRFAALVAAWSLGFVFAMFLVGVVARLINRPIGWIDEAVTLVSVWSTFWTAAFVLKWPEHIAFDIVYTSASNPVKRAFLVIGLIGFSALMLAAMPGMIDYTLFLWRERTDALLLRLDFVYAIFPIFFLVIIGRMLFSVWRLVTGHWQRELDHWSGADTSPGDKP